MNGVLLNSLVSGLIGSVLALLAGFWWTRHREKASRSLMLFDEWHSHDMYPFRIFAEAFVDGRPRGAPRIRFVDLAAKPPSHPDRNHLRVIYFMVRMAILIDRREVDRALLYRLFRVWLPWAIQRYLDAFDFEAKESRYLKAHVQTLESFVRGRSGPIWGEPLTEFFLGRR